VALAIAQATRAPAGDVVESFRSQLMIVVDEHRIGWLWKRVDPREGASDNWWCLS